MSEKHSTDEFINWLGGQISIHPYITPVITKTIAQENEATRNAIIVKLRAGDKLAEDVKHEIEVTDDERIAGRFRKAIVDYEGKR